MYNVAECMLPLKLMIEEHARLRRRGQERDKQTKKVLAREERTRTLRIRQEQWELSGYGRWTYQLILDTGRWIQTMHGDVVHHIMQILAGHGAFSTVSGQTWRNVTR